MSKRRGQPSNNRLAEETRGKALDLLKKKYQGFGPTLAHEKLTEMEGLTISDERLRQLMIEEGLWKGKKAARAYVDIEGCVLRSLFSPQSRCRANARTFNR